MAHFSAQVALYVCNIQAEVKQIICDTAALSIRYEDDKFNVKDYKLVDAGAAARKVLNIPETLPETGVHAISLDDFEGLWKYAEDDGWAIRISHIDDQLKATSVSIKTGEGAGGYGFVTPYILEFPSSEEVPLSISGHEVIAGQGQNISLPVKIVMSEDKQRITVYHYGKDLDLSNFVIEDLEEFLSDKNIDFVEEFVRMDEDEIGVSESNPTMQEQELATLTSDEAFQIVAKNLPVFFNNGQEWITEQAAEENVFQFAVFVDGQANLRMYVRQIDENEISVDFFTSVSAPQGPKYEEYIFSID